MSESSSSLTSLQVAVLPFRIDDLIYVLLIRPDGGKGWRLPTALSCKGNTQHANAAAAALRQAGVTGRVYKAPLRSAGQDRRISVFPLRVQAHAASSAGRATARWFSLKEAGALIDGDYRPLLDAFARRMGEPPAIEMPPPALSRLVARRDRMASSEQSYAVTRP